MKPSLSTAASSAAILLAGLSPAFAQSLESCDWVASAANLVEPWAETTQTLGEGVVRIALLDTGGEPICCSRHLLLLYPGEYGQGCQVLSAEAGTGFREVYIDEVESSYRMGEELLLSIPVGDYDPDTGDVLASSIRPVQMRFDLSMGEVMLQSTTPAVVSTAGPKK
ncbi:hypothetical protein [Pseudophaeobacter sp.]|uniref:hypothetical protein n=1 Tax=Pseudophaeobacter sp. TaxID=1971739 RepID=UPI0032996E90